MNDAKPTRSGFAVAILGALAAFAFLGLTIAYKYTGDFTGLRHTVPLGNNTPLLTMLVPLTSAMSRLLLNIEKRSLLRLMLSSDGLASKDAV